MSITVVLTNDECLKHFHTALCNGTQMWSAHGIKLTFFDAHYDNAKKQLTKPCYEDVLIQILKDGHPLTLTDIEGNGVYTRSIRLQDVIDRLPKAPLDHLNDMFNGDDDAITADVILQQCFLNEVVFG